MHQPLHVAHLTSAHPSGDTRIFVKECRSLARAGYRVTLIATNAVKETKDGVNIIGVPFSGGRIKRMLQASKAVYKKALEVNADIYHFHDPELLPYGVKLAQKGKIVFYDSHEDLPRQVMTKHYIPVWMRKWVSQITEARENKAARQLAGVIAATPIIRQRFEKIGVHCIDVCNYPSLEDMPSPTPFSQKEKVACYIGSITEVRGIREKINAMNGASFTLHIAGAFSPAELETEMRNQPGWHHVQYHGFADRKGVRRLLDQSMVGLVTLRPVKSFSEALPVKMFEYMAAGIPVIATDIPLWKSIIDDAQCGVSVDVFDEEQLRSSIETLLNDSSRAEQMGKNGRKAVEEKYNWSIEEQKMLHFYSSIATTAK